MRLVHIAAMFVVVVTQANAGTVTVTFSGTAESSLGVINTGDVFSGTMTWDSTDLSQEPLVDVAYATSLTIEGPAEDGLSVAGLGVPPSEVNFAGGIYSLSDSFDYAQVNETSTNDNNLYAFYLYPTFGYIELDSDPVNFTMSSYSFTYAETPEPATNTSIGSGLGLIAACALRRRRRQTELLNSAKSQ